MSLHKRIVIVAAALIAAATLAPSVRAERTTGADVVAACRAKFAERPGLGERTCRTAEQLERGFANGCRNAGRTSACATLDGRRTGAKHIATYLRSWTHRALSLQRGLDDNVALARATIPHTHNSFNSSVYTPTVTNQDPNQIYSITDQLQMDVRAIEMDLHWFPSVHGTPRTFGRAVVLCHGTQANGVHVGCSTDRWFPQGLVELHQWLRRPENATEIVLLYLENQLGPTKLAHDTAADEIATQLGDLVARPPAGQPCAPLPTSTTPAQLRAAGHRVIIVGNCGPGRWGAWVHERGPSTNWWESSSGPTDEYPGLRGCAAERARTHGGSAMVRWYEDSTWVTAVTSGRSGHLTAKEAAAMARCGVSLIGFDQLTPEDPRLPAMVWSWAPGAPAAPRGVASCAASGTDGRFHDSDCADRHAYVCMRGTDTWSVTATEGQWNAGAVACNREFPGSAYAAPANGWENSLLRGAATDRLVWIKYRDTAGSGSWRA